MPAYNPNPGRAALDQYDTNKDGRIGGDELGGCPPLASALDRIDSNSDRAISGEEIDERIRQWRDKRIALMPVSCKVLLDGKPASGVRVVFLPESFLGTGVRRANGVTDADGIASLTISPEQLPDPFLSGYVAPGFSSSSPRSRRADGPSPTLPAHERGVKWPPTPRGPAPVT